MEVSMKKNIIYIIGILIIWTAIILGIILFPSNNKKQSLDIESDFIQNLYQLAIPNDYAPILNQLYNNDTFTNEYKLTTSITTLLNKMNIEDVQDITLNAIDVEKTAKEIFGQDVKIEHQRLLFMIKNACGFEYDEKKQQYNSFSGCGGLPFEFFSRKLIKAEENENQIILTEQIAYAYININNDYKASDIYIYNNSRQDKMLDFKQFDRANFNESELAQYIDSGSTYELIFEKENDNYIFKQCLLKK